MRADIGAVKQILLLQQVEKRVVETTQEVSKGRPGDVHIISIDWESLDQPLNV